MSQDHIDIRKYATEVIVDKIAALQKMNDFNCYHNGQQVMLLENGNARLIAHSTYCKTLEI